jgi:hypothetical protein
MIATLRRLDTVSRVTVHVFMIEVAMAAFAASFAESFVATFTFALLALATLQFLAAATSHPPQQSGLDELDGALWLTALAFGAQVF